MNKLQYLQYLGKLGNQGDKKQSWTPARLSNLSLWLDAADASTITLNGTTVSQWNDKSGNSRHATQATASLQPTYTASGIGGKPSLTFAPQGGSAQDRLDVTFTLTTNNITAFALAKKPSDSGDVKHRYGRVLSFRNTSGNDYSNTNGWIPAFMAQQDAFDGVNPPSIVNFRNNATITAQPMVYNTPYIIGSTLSGSTGTMRVNGNQTSGTTSATAVNINQMLIGASSNGVDSEMYGDIAEVIVTPALSLADQQRIEGYLAWKWGLVHNLPVNHPYRWDGREFGYTFSGITDTDAQTYIAGVETADGQVLENATRTAIQNFIVGAKADGIWDAIKSSNILAGARTLSGALVPLKGTAPTNFNFVSGDYNRKTGLVGDGITKYLDSNRNNNADPQNNQHMSVYATTPNTGTLWYMGAGVTQAGATHFYSLNGSSFGTRNRNSSSGSDINTNSAGLFGMSRNNSSSYVARNNSTNYTLSITSQTPLNSDVHVFHSSTSTEAYSNARLAFYSIGEALDLALLDTRVTQLMTDLGNAIP